MKVSKLIEDLQENYSPDAEVVGVVWTIFDVYYACNMFGYEKPSKEIAEKILIHIEDNFNSEYGISWSTFEDVLEDFEIPVKNNLED